MPQETKPSMLLQAYAELRNTHGLAYSIRKSKRGDWQVGYYSEFGYHVRGEGVTPAEAVKNTVPLCHDPSKTTRGWLD